MNTDFSNHPDLQGAPPPDKPLSRSFSSVVFYLLVTFIAGLASTIVGMGVYISRQPAQYQNGYEAGIEFEKRNCDGFRLIDSVKIAKLTHDNDSLRNDNTALLKGSYETLLNYLNVKPGKTKIVIENSDTK